MPDVKFDNPMLNRLPVDPAPLLPVGNRGLTCVPQSAGTKETHAVSHSQAIQPSTQTSSFPSA